MAILNNINLTSSMLARMSTLEQLGMSEQEKYEFFVLRQSEQQELINSGMMENPEVQMELVVEYRDCATFVRSSMERNEKLRVQNLNAMQYAKEFSATTVGDLMHLLEELQSRWTDEDTRYVGALKSLPLCVKDDCGISLGKMKLAPEHGLVALVPDSE